MGDTRTWYCPRRRAADLRPHKRASFRPGCAQDGRHLGHQLLRFARSDRRQRLGEGAGTTGMRGTHGSLRRMSVEFPRSADKTRPGASAQRCRLKRG